MTYPVQTIMTFGNDAETILNPVSFWGFISVSHFMLFVFAFFPSLFCSNLFSCHSCVSGVSF